MSPVQTEFEVLDPTSDEHARLSPWGGEIIIRERATVGSDEKDAYYVIQRDTPFNDQGGMSLLFKAIPIKENGERDDDHPRLFKFFRDSILEDGRRREMAVSEAEHWQNIYKTGSAGRLIGSVSELPEEIRSSPTIVNVPLVQSAKDLQVLLTGANPSLQERLHLVREVLFSVNLMHHDRYDRFGGHADSENPGLDHVIPAAVHRDIKLENFLVRKTESRVVQQNKAGEKKTSVRGVYPIDFEMAAPADSQEKKKLGGTPGYIAPEAHRGIADISSDIYSLAPVIAEMIGGDPFKDKLLGNISLKGALMPFNFERVLGKMKKIPGTVGEGLTVGQATVLFLERMASNFSGNRPDSDEVLRFFTTLYNYIRLREALPKDSELSRAYPEEEIKTLFLDKLNELLTEKKPAIETLSDADKLRFFASRKENFSDQDDFEEGLSKLDLSAETKRAFLGDFKKIVDLDLRDAAMHLLESSRRSGGTIPSNWMFRKIGESSPGLTDADKLRIFASQGENFASHDAFQQGAEKLILSSKTRDLLAGSFGMLGDFDSNLRDAAGQVLGAARLARLDLAPDFAFLWIGQHSRLLEEVPVPREIPPKPVMPKEKARLSEAGPSYSSEEISHGAPVSRLTLSDSGKLMVLAHKLKAIRTVDSLRKNIENLHLSEDTQRKLSSADGDPEKLIEKAPQGGALSKEDRQRIAESQNLSNAMCLVLSGLGFDGEKPSLTASSSLGAKVINSLVSEVLQNPERSSSLMGLDKFLYGAFLSSLKDYQAKAGEPEAVTFLMDILSGQKNLKENLQDFKRFSGVLSRGELGKLVAPVIKTLEEQAKIATKEIKEEAKVKRENPLLRNPKGGIMKTLSDAELHTPLLVRGDEERRGEKKKSLGIA